MLDHSELSRWRAAAGDALQASRDNAEAGWPNWACMIAEQAAQLAVKGLLHGTGRGDRARGHDLVRLLQTAADLAGLALSETVREAGIRLARHYQPSRYPDALPGGTPRERYTDADADTAITDAAQVLRAVDDAISALRSSADEGAGDDDSP